MSKSFVILEVALTDEQLEDLHNFLDDNSIVPERLDVVDMERL